MLTTVIVARLVWGTQDSNTVPWTVLDEQRRMRPAIADLTRGDYKDLVSIQDHPITVSRRLGDMTGLNKVLAAERPLWPGMECIVVQDAKFSYRCAC